MRHSLFRSVQPYFQFRLLDIIRWSTNQHRAHAALFLTALLLGLPVLVLMTQFLAVALGDFTGVRVWIAPFLRYPAGRAAIQAVLPVLSGICTGLFACTERRF